MSDLLKHLEPGAHGPKPGTSDFAQLRKVPLQPDGVPLGVVFMGAELGFLPWSGTRPRAGDTVAVVGAPGSRTVIAREQPTARNPMFGARCVCRCPASSDGGLIFYVTSVSFTSTLLIVDGATGAVVVCSRLPEVILAQGVAVDPEPPYDLFILDNRQNTQNLIVDDQTTPDPEKQWWFVHKYQVSGNDYTIAATEILPDFPTGDIAIQTTNSMAVFDGEVWIPRFVSPATILKWSGSGFTTRALTLDGAPFDALPFGPVVQVGTRPAPTESYFALVTVGPTFEVVQFSADGAITGRLQDNTLTEPRALLTVCNRLVVFQASGATRSEVGSGEEEGEEGGGGEGGGEEQ